MTQHAELLAAWRAEAGPSTVERARTWDGIAARAELADPIAEEVAPPTPVAARSLVRPRFVVGAVALAAAAVLVLAIAPRGRELARTVEPALQQSIRAVLPTIVVRPTHAVTPAIAPPAIVPMAPPVIVPLVEPAPVRPRARRIAPASIDPAEVELLERAQRRLAKDPGEALALFEQHAREYPRSALAAERELGRADAACRSGDVAGARALVDRFARTRKSSPLLARMRSICADG